MKLSDWFGFPGSLEHQNTMAMIEAQMQMSVHMTKMGDSINSLVEILRGINERLVAVEEVLRTHGLAK